MGASRRAVQPDSGCARRRARPWTHRGKTMRLAAQEAHLHLNASANEGRSADTHRKFARYVQRRDPAIRDVLVTMHLGLVQVASLAIIKAVDRFDPTRGVEFTTYATRTVIGELKRHFRDRGWSVRAPRRVQELYLELGQTISDLSQQLGRSPRVDELAKATGATEEAVLEALEAGQGYRSTSIDVADRQDELLARRLSIDDSRLAEIDDRSVLAPALARLAPRERWILHLRFVDGLTQSEIAAQIGISQMHVSRLLKASLAQLRRAFAEGA